MTFTKRCDTMKIIARIYNDFNEKFGIPRQSGLLPEMESIIVFEKEFRNDDALRGISEFSHLWLIWGFSENSDIQWSPTVRPPRLGGNKRMGVFATRSPFRPNSLGLSSVKLKDIERMPGKGSVLKVTGADLMNGTPIYDIKPYIAYTDSHPDATCGFSDDYVDYALDVIFSNDLSEKVDSKDLNTLTEILKNDPRPSYQNDENRIYKMSFSKYEISFKVSENTLTVIDIQ